MSALRKMAPTDADNLKASRDALRSRLSRYRCTFTVGPDQDPHPVPLPLGALSRNADLLRLQTDLAKLLHEDPVVVRALGDAQAGPMRSWMQEQLALFVLDIVIASQEIETLMERVSQADPSTQNAPGARRKAARKSEA
jgi:hypothetical protein